MSKSSSPYWIRAGRDEDWMTGVGIQQFDYTDEVEKSNTFSLYIDSGAFSYFLEYGMYVELYHNQERIFKGRIMSIYEDDSGLQIGGNDLMVAFPNVYVDAYKGESDLKFLIEDLMDRNKLTRHVDGIDAVTYVYPTNLSMKWDITDQTLMKMLKDLVSSSQDPSSLRKNTFFLDPYSNLHIEPIGASGMFTGAIDIQKRKIGGGIDGNFCNYAVMRGMRSSPMPANRDTWTEHVGNWIPWLSNDTVEEDNDDSVINQGSIKYTMNRSGVSYYMLGVIGWARYKDMTGGDYIEGWIKATYSGETLDTSASGFVILDFEDENIAYAWYEDSVFGAPAMVSDEWYFVRIPLNYGGLDGDVSQAKYIFHQQTFSTEKSSGRTMSLDGLAIIRSEKVATLRDEKSIKTFGLFEKRKRDPKLRRQSDTEARAQELFNPYPKINYNVTANDYVPIGLNQMIEVRWRDIDWVLPLTQKKVMMKAGVTNTMMQFGGKAISIDDTIQALAAETRTEAYGKRSRAKKDIEPSGDPENHTTYESDDGQPEYGDFGELEDPITLRYNYGGKSPEILSEAEELYYQWCDFNKYKGDPCA